MKNETVNQLLRNNPVSLKEIKDYMSGKPFTESQRIKREIICGSVEAWFIS